MKVKKSESEGYVEPKLGLTQAVVTAIYDVGTSEGKFGPKHEVMIQLSLPTQHHIYDEAVGPEPLHISKWFALSLHKKSNLRSFIEGIKGDIGDPDEYEVMDLLGVNLMVHVTERTKDDGTKTTSVGAVTPLMDGLQEYKLETSKFDLSEFKQDEFNALSDKMQERVRKSDEFQTAPW